MSCRLCGGGLTQILDLGVQPLANSLIGSKNDSEVFYPLVFCKCEYCGHFQVNETILPDQIFNKDYPYYTSVNKSYVRQCEVLAKDLIQAFNPKNVLEIGCNDGYMLKNFFNIDHLGIDPSYNVINAAKTRGLNVTCGFFGDSDYGKFDLIIANNVIAHTPTPQEFVSGIKRNLSQNGTVVIECPDVSNLIANLEFDTIYHEHYSYFSHSTMQSLLAKHGLEIFKTENLESHGGSIRYYVRHGMTTEFTQYIPGIEDFVQKVLEEKTRWMNKITMWYWENKRVSCFGAAAKGNVFLNYLGIKSDLINFCFDETTQKQNKFLPGSRIPITYFDGYYPSDGKVHSSIHLNMQNIILILPWNFRKEITDKIQKTGFKGEIVCRI